MKTIGLFFILLFVSALFSCNCPKKDSNCEKDSLIEQSVVVKAGTFYSSDLNSNNAIVLADTISYDVTIKCPPNTEEEWIKEDLRRMDEKALANIIYNAIYNKRLTAYDYEYNTPISIEEVKKKESRFSRDKIGRMRFVEEWYFDENSLQFGKKVNSIMIAYEDTLPDGQVRYIPGVTVYLNDSSKNRTSDIISDIN